MTLIKKAVNQEINEMSHEPLHLYEGQWLYTYPDISWENVYFRLLDGLEEHVDLDSVPDGITISVLDEVIEQAKQSQWVQELLHDAREEHHEYIELQENPYASRGLSKSYFLNR